MKITITSLICLILSALLVLPVFAGGVMVASDVEVVSEDVIEKDNHQPTAQDLEKIIKLVKPKLNIPEEYAEFEWDYYGGNLYQNPEWNLRWWQEVNGERYTVYVTCDNKGRISNYRIRDEKSYTESFPEYTKNELIDTAKDFLKKIAPDANLYFDKANNAYGRYSNEYSYTFVRRENGIDVAENYAEVSVNFTTGTVSSCYITYDYDPPFIPAENPIDVNKAKDIIHTKQKMKLVYSRLTEKDENGKTVTKAVLTYVPELYYISADAITGEIYLERRTYLKGTGGNDSVTNESIFGSMADKFESEEYRLTEKELEQLAVLKNLITKEKAIEIISSNEYLYLDKELTVANATLSKKDPYKVLAEGEKNDEYVWRINFSNPTDEYKDYYYYNYADATVDAQNGRIISFNSSIKGYDYYIKSEKEFPEKNFTKEQCEEIFKTFANGNIPEIINLTEKSSEYETNAINYLTDSSSGKIVQTPVYGAYSFTNTRVNEGIAFTYNTVNCAVDAVSGKIFSFGYNWTDDVIFESPKDAISEDSAYEIYCDLSDFGIYYERYDEIKDSGVTVTEDKYLNPEELYDVTTVYRSVYAAKNSDIRISALRSVRVTYSGAPYTENYDGEFSDISSHWAERDIILLSNLGVIEQSEKFLPDSEITSEEFEKMLSGAYLGITENIGSEKITRLCAVKSIIDSLGYGKVASLSQIYKTDFADASSISESDVGYVALAKGLGIIRGDGAANTFRPDDILTKAESVKLISEAIKSLYR